jgi:DNA-binding transcriptional LysR family regulator
LAFDALDPKVGYFLKCARADTFRGACQQMGITQAALSTSIRKLEEELGGTLFERSTKGVKLTSEGRALLKILERSRKTLLTEMRLALNRPQHEALRVGCASHVGVHELFPLLETHRAILPPMQLAFGYSLRCYEGVKEGKLDFAFVTWTSKPKGVESSLIREDRKAIVGLKSKFGHIVRAKTREALRNEPWILQPKPQYDWTEFTDPDQSGFVVHDMFAHRELVLRGAGICASQLTTFTPKELKRLAISPAPVEGSVPHLFAIHRSDISQRAKEQLEFLVGKLKR